MRKLILALILIPTLCFGGPLQDKQRSVIAAKNAGGAPPSCSGVFGSESNPTSYSTYSGDQLYCTRATWTGACSGTVSKVSIYLHSDTDATAVKAAIYSDDGQAEPRPLTLLAASSEKDPSAAATGWYDFDGGTIGMSTSASNPTYYWICVWNDASSNGLDFGQTLTSGVNTWAVYDYSTYSGVFPSTWPDGYSPRSTTLYAMHADVQ